MYRRVIGPRGFLYSPRVETAPQDRIPHAVTHSNAVMIGDFQSRVNFPATRDYCERPPAAAGGPYKRFGKLLPAPHCLDYSAAGNNNSLPSGSTILITS